MTATSYFRRLSQTRFRPTEHVVGAWNTDEQHIAPAIGLLTHLIEKDRDLRRDDALRLARVGCEIFGVLTLDEMEVTLRVIRPGRTIELVEAELVQHGRIAVVLRAWLLQRIDTTAIAGITLEPMPASGSMEPADFDRRWPGGFVRTVESRKRELEPGRAQCWIRPRVPLLEGEEVSPIARMLGGIDIANGMTPRVAPNEVAFPNVDFTANLLRDATGDADSWIGLDVRVSFGPDGTGITESVVHDEQGPVGTLSQTLTLRPL